VRAAFFSERVVHVYRIHCLIVLISVHFQSLDAPSCVFFHRLAHVTGSVFTWVQSYLTGRSQIVQLGSPTSHSSNPTLCLVGWRTPGISPWTTFIYTSPISHIAEVYNNTNMLMTHDCSWLLPQIMCMLNYPLSNLICYHCKPGSVPIV